MEPINSIENAIIIKSFTNKDYKSIKKLIYDKVKKYKMGDKINKNQTFMLRNELGIIENIGSSFKIQLLTGNKIYNSMYVFAKTKVGYLWIIFTATPETYKINISKFKTFLKGLKIINEK